MVFDSLLLLKRGGETVFFGELGENASQLIQYFESVPNVTPIEDGYNPATWMLEVIGAGVGNVTDTAVNFVDTFNRSKQHACLEAALQESGIGRPKADVQGAIVTSKRAASASVQAKMLLVRFFRAYWRTPSYNLTRIIVSLVVAIVFGLLFVDVDYNTFQGINAGVGMILTTTVFVGLIALNGVMPITFEERAVYYRERASNAYSAWWYFVAATIVEVPYVFGSTFLFTAVYFPMVGFSGVEQFFQYWFNLALQTLLQTYMGQFLVFAFPNVQIAAIAGMLINSVFLLFMGVNPPSNAIPSGYSWLAAITPQKYTLAVLSATVFGDCPGGESSSTGKLGCNTVKMLPPTVPPNLTVKQFIEAVFEMRHDEIWRNVAIVLCMLFIVRMLGLVALRFINHQRK
ncbi:hypothetical protein P43SY_001716 [Pythium insidiosum]|uniref:ABC-2 type transporter transmembrane domain-containing protein n=1 Tax=Pythium insidiosum TaxID=114742 RepID=A0AAD5M086_PYTIN|nr:hypothetical protein P43SY_001716 [Pythium insidiosum]